MEKPETDYKFESNEKGKEILAKRGFTVYPKWQVYPTKRPDDYPLIGLLSKIPASVAILNEDGSLEFMDYPAIHPEVIQYRDELKEIIKKMKGKKRVQ